MFQNPVTACVTNVVSLERVKNRVPRVLVDARAAASNGVSPETMLADLAWVSEMIRANPEALTRLVLNRGDSAAFSAAAKSLRFPATFRPADGARAINEIALVLTAMILCCWGGGGGGGICGAACTCAGANCPILVAVGGHVHCSKQNTELKCPGTCTLGLPHAPAAHQCSDGHSF